MNTYVYINDSISVYLLRKLYSLSRMPWSLIAENRGEYTWPSSRSMNDVVFGKLQNCTRYIKLR